MLKAEVSTRMKAFTLLNDLVWFVAGAAWFISETEHTGPLEKSPIEIIIGLSLMSLTSTSLVIDWCFRNIHTRYRANSRTIAILRPGRPTTYINRGDCAGLINRETSFKMKNGAIMELSFHVGIRLNKQEEFLIQLYSMWWPTVQLHDVRTYFSERVEVPRAPWLILPMLGAIAAILWITMRYGQSVLGLMAALVASWATLWIIFHLHKRSRRNRNDVLYPTP